MPLSGSTDRRARIAQLFEQAAATGTLPEHLKPVYAEGVRRGLLKPVPVGVVESAVRQAGHSLGDMALNTLLALELGPPALLDRIRYLYNPNRTEPVSDVLLHGKGVEPRLADPVAAAIAPAYDAAREKLESATGFKDYEKPSLLGQFVGEVASFLLPGVPVGKATTVGKLSKLVQKLEERAAREGSRVAAGAARAIPKATTGIGTMVPGTVGYGERRQQEIAQQGGDSANLLASYLANAPVMMAMGAVPVSMSGNLLARAATGAAFNTGLDTLQVAAERAALGEDAKRFGLDYLDPFRTGTAAGLGAAMAAALGPRAGAAARAASEGARSGAAAVEPDVRVILDAAQAGTAPPARTPAPAPAAAEAPPPGPSGYNALAELYARGGLVSPYEGGINYRPVEAEITTAPGAAETRARAPGVPYVPPVEGLELEPRIMAEARTTRVPPKLPPPRPKPPPRREPPPSLEGAEPAKASGDKLDWVRVKGQPAHVRMTQVGDAVLRVEALSKGRAKVDLLAPDGTVLASREGLSGIREAKRAGEELVAEAARRAEEPPPAAEASEAPRAQEPQQPEAPAQEIEQPVPPEPAPRAEEPPAPRKTARQRYEEAARVNPEQDDILAAIAKLGGWSREDAELSGIDPAEFRRRGWRIKPVFTKKGRSADALAEALAEHGYPVVDEHGNPDPNVLLDRVSDALLGERVMTPEGTVRRAELEAEEAPVRDEPEPEGEALRLEDYSEEDLLAREAELQAQREAEQQALREAEERARADEELKDFRLTGGTSEADVAMAYGQRGLPLERAGERAGTSEPDPMLRAKTEAIHRRVEGIVRRWNGAPEITVVARADQLPNTGRRLEGKSQGLYYKGKAYLVAENLRSDREVLDTLWHEVFGHAGVLRWLVQTGQDWRQFARDVALSMPKEVEAVRARRNLPRTRDGMDIAALEYVAELAESGHTLKGRARTILSRAIAWVRDALRRAGFRLKLSDDDIRAAIAKGVGALEVSPKGKVRLAGEWHEASPEPRTESAEVAGLSRIDEGGGEHLSLPERWERAADPYWQKAAALTRQILSKVKLADTLSPEAKRALRRMRAEIGMAEERALEVQREVAKLSEAERRMVSDYIEGELEAGITPPERVVKVAQAMVAVTEKLADELVAAGWLPEAARERWRGRYLHRYYTSKLLDNPFDKALRGLHRALMRGVSGSYLRGRGIAKWVKAKDAQRYIGEGWEVRDQTEDKVLVWRDLTREEREKLGEIRDAGFRFIRGYLEASKDLAMARLFERIADDPNLSSDIQVDPTWVQVPKTEIVKGVYRYGKLAGKWVHPDLLDHLKPMREEKSALMRAYLKALSLWKEGKTSLNPVVHSNNVVSTVIMADLAGVHPWQLGKYRAALKDYTSKGRYYREAVEAGLFGTEFYGNEIAELMPPASAFRDAESAAAGWVSRTIDAVARYSGARAYREKMGRLYRAEDQFFKLLLFKDARERGVDVDEAVDWANRWVFDYTDIPAGVRAIKQFPIGLPFFSYTYKAIPALAYAAVHHPVRFAKWGMLFGGLNWYAYESLFGDEADERERAERAVLPDYLSGYTLFPGVPKSMRLPRNDRTGEALLLDLSRRMPLGDLFDAANQWGGVPILQPFMPNNPVFTIMQAVLMNMDTFTGEKIYEDYDDAWTRAEKLGARIFKQLTPNTPVMPGSYAWSKVMSGLAGSLGRPVTVPGFGTYTGEDYYGRRQNLTRAILATTIGHKVRSVDLRRQFKRRMGELDKLTREIRQNIATTQRNRGLSPAEKRQKLDELRERLRAVAERRAELAEVAAPALE